MRKLTVRNQGDHAREIKVFFHHDFHLYSDGIGDTAGYDPKSNSIFHYKRKRFFLITASTDNKKSCIRDYNIGTADKHTIEDAQDGKLEKNAIAQGKVDSIFSVPLKIKAKKEKTVYYWICAGKNYPEVSDLNKFVLKKKPEKLFFATNLCWQGLVNKVKVDFKDLSEDIREHYRRSILIVRTQIDNNGAVVAANDSDNMQFNHDTYSYVWPRDGALIAIAMQKAGYPELVKKFYNFCKEVISKDGYFLHKYTPDKELGSSWHPWIKDGKPNLPIQEDETALVVIALWHYYETTKDKAFVRQLYKPLIKKAANFMVQYREKGLPKESYDLWEERQGVLTFTCAAVCGGLRAAARFAKLYKDRNAKKYQTAADNTQAAMAKKLYDKNKKRFLRMIGDGTVESTVYSTFAFGGFAADDEKVVSSMRQVEDVLGIKSKIGGIARYQNDYYHKVSDNYPGNPWFISTIWLGRWYAETAKTKKDLKKVKDVLEWCVQNSLETGIMPEQLHPETGEPLSVSPLTWSHAEFIWLVQDYIEKYDALPDS